MAILASWAYYVFCSLAVILIFRIKRVFRVEYLFLSENKLLARKVIKSRFEVILTWNNFSSQKFTIELENLPFLGHRILEFVKVSRLTLRCPLSLHLFFTIMLHRFWPNNNFFRLFDQSWHWNGSSSINYSTSPFSDYFVYLASKFSYFRWKNKILLATNGQWPKVPLFLHMLWRDYLNFLDFFFDKIGKISCKIKKMKIRQKIFSRFSLFFLTAFLYFAIGIVYKLSGFPVLPFKCNILHFY